MADTPIWAKGSDSRRFLVDMMCCFTLLFTAVGLRRGAGIVLAI
jgi:hypothetical protein